MTGDQEFQLLSMIVPSITILVTAVAIYIRTRALENKLDSNTATTLETRDKTEQTQFKLDENTVLARGNVDKLKRIDQQTNGDLDKIKDEVHRMSEQIRQIELGMAKGQEIAQREIVSTRHELRGHLGTLTNTINSLLLVQGLAPVKPPQEEAKREGS